MKLQNKGLDKVAYTLQLGIGVGRQLQPMTIQPKTSEVIAQDYSGNKSRQFSSLDCSVADRPRQYQQASTEQTTVYMQYPDVQWQADQGSANRPPLNKLQCTCIAGRPRQYQQASTEQTTVYMQYPDIQWQAGQGSANRPPLNKLQLAGRPRQYQHASTEQTTVYMQYPDIQWQAGQGRTNRPPLNKLQCTCSTQMYSGRQAKADQQASTEQTTVYMQYPDIQWQAGQGIANRPPLNKLQCICSTQIYSGRQAKAVPTGLH
ncbi:hypothetical protein DPMN_134148 [Dreissena polymorpha]|uniref:Uncharacterized protein n=1 Tax=Dreissena polymorpha TaxID=45954 RepID=A0A9D4FV26_DREPO|nr:hypothetical protein DPMN_134148 [Dreissena polymorpha]